MLFISYTCTLKTSRTVTLARNGVGWGQNLYHWCFRSYQLTSPRNQWPIPYFLPGFKAYVLFYSYFSTIFIIFLWFIINYLYILLFFLFQNLDHFSTNVSTFFHDFCSNFCNFNPFLWNFYQLFYDFQRFFSHF